jgi:hypothetical protein
MGKRSDFKRLKGDFYETPAAAVAPLIAHLDLGTTGFIEPCAGAGKLVGHLESYGLLCVAAFDIEPRGPGIIQKDALELTAVDLAGADMIITNPPWSRPLLHGLIDHLLQFCLPVWLLFDADWMFTRQAAEFKPFLCEIVSVGRVKWIDGSPHAGKDNAAWYQFGAFSMDAPRFHLRRDPVELSELSE